MSSVLETPSPHPQNAQEIMVALRQLIHGMRGYKLMATGRRRKITISGHVDDEFLRQVAVMLDVTPHVAAGAQLTGAEIRDHLSFYASYEGVGDELILLGTGAKDTLLNEHADFGERALRAVTIAMAITKPEDREKLIPHLDNIRKNFSRGKRRKTRKPPEAQVTPEAPKVTPEAPKAVSS